MYGKGKGGKVYPKERMGVTFHLRFLNCPTLLSARAGSFTGPTRWLVVKASALSGANLGSNPDFAVGIFPVSSHFRILRMSTPVATLTGTWRYRVSTGTAKPCVGTL